MTDHERATVELLQLLYKLERLLAAYEVPNLEPSFKRLEIVVISQTDVLNLVENPSSATFLWK